jgi:hypothetical protein
MGINISKNLTEVLRGQSGSPGEALFLGGNNNLYLIGATLDGSIVSYQGSVNFVVEPGVISNAGVTVDENLTSTNAGVIESVNSTISITDGGDEFANSGAMIFGANSQATIVTGVVNTGLIEAAPGGSLFVGGRPGSPGSIINTGLVDAYGGSITANDTYIQQSKGGTTIIQDNGSLTLDIDEIGGTIQIQSGMLTIPAGPSFAPGAQTPASIAFTGRSGDVVFNGAPGPLAIDFMPTDIVVFQNVGGQWKYMNDIALAGSYSASEFSVHKNELVFTDLRARN